MLHDIVTKIKTYFGFTPDWRDHPPCVRCGKPVQRTYTEEGWLYAQPCGDEIGHDPRPWIQCLRCNHQGYGETFDVGVDGDSWACPVCGMDESGLEIG